MLIALLIVIAGAAREPCNRVHSSYYDTHQPIRTSDYWYFGSQWLNTDRCEPMTNQQFRQYVVAAGIITEAELVAGQWQVEHIVDTNGVPEPLESHSKAIRGNLLLAKPGWNQGVGNLCWQNARAEKEAVYGAAVVENAVSAVLSCSPVQTGSWSALLICVGVAGFALLALSGVICGNACRLHAVEAADDGSARQQDHTDMRGIGAPDWPVNY